LRSPQQGANPQWARLFQLQAYLNTIMTHFDSLFGSFLVYLVCAVTVAVWLLGACAEIRKKN